MCYLTQHEATAVLPGDEGLESNTGWNRSWQGNKQRWEREFTLWVKPAASSHWPTAPRKQMHQKVEKLTACMFFMRDIRVEEHSSCSVEMLGSAEPSQQRPTPLSGCAHRNASVWTARRQLPVSTRTVTTRHTGPVEAKFASLLGWKKKKVARHEGGEARSCG